MKPEIRPTENTGFGVAEIVGCINALGSALDVATTRFYPLRCELGTDADYSRG